MKKLISILAIFVMVLTINAQKTLHVFPTYDTLDQVEFDFDDFEPVYDTINAIEYESSIVYDTIPYCWCNISWCGDYDSIKIIDRYEYPIKESKVVRSVIRTESIAPGESSDVEYVLSCGCRVTAGRLNPIIDHSTEMYVRHECHHGKKIHYKDTVRYKKYTKYEYKHRTVQIPVSKQKINKRYQIILTNIICYKSKANAYYDVFGSIEGYNFKLLIGEQNSEKTYWVKVPKEVYERYRNKENIQILLNDILKIQQTTNKVNFEINTNE